MKQVRFVMLGGFLGAGKTTALARLARHYQGQGLKVGVITNDQAENLVDTATFRDQGWAAEEIPGGCFCCRFDALAQAAGRLALAERPDVLLAEPVGSCTDLVATVVQPLKRLYADRYWVAPYVVLLDPARAQDILAERRFGGFSPKVAYIFHKQLEEADVIALNKADTLAPAEQGELLDLIRRNYPAAEVLAVSARTGDGFERLTALIGRDGAFGRNIPSVDYDTYAEGEAELGWLNRTARLVAERRFALDDLLAELAARLRAALRREGAEVAHLKMRLQAGDAASTVNLVRGDALPELSRRAAVEAPAADLTVNARVHTDPDALSRVVGQCLEEVCAARGIAVTPGRDQHFRPGRPVPTHRFAEAV
jgi:G3E family GTPase